MIELLLKSNNTSITLNFNIQKKNMHAGHNRSIYPAIEVTVLVSSASTMHHLQVGLCFWTPFQRTKVLSVIYVQLTCENQLQLINYIGACNGRISKDFPVALHRTQGLVMWPYVTSKGNDVSYVYLYSDQSKSI